MQPVITPAEMAAIDAAAPDPVEELIRRAAAAVANTAIAMLGGRYGKRVLVVAGKGNNGADGRVAAELLHRQGIRVRVMAAADTIAASACAEADLVIDAAYGTGFRGDYSAPDFGPTPVLAVDIPSGVDGLTGAAGSGAVQADRTITFAALKPGLLFAPGSHRAGMVTIADIGLDCSQAKAWHLEACDLGQGWPRSGPDAHKWQRAVWVIGGAATMTGAPALATSAALRAGASYAAVSVPGLDRAGPPLPMEAVVRPLDAEGWAATVIEGHERFGALIIGPGLMPNEPNRAAVRAVVAATGVTGLVLDGGALDAVAEAPSVLRSRLVPAVLTPHNGELARMLARPIGIDRVSEARSAAEAWGVVLVLKGPTTIVADPAGQVLLSTAGDQRLATAGTGDALAGAIGAGLAGGLDPFHAAGLGVELHGRAARQGRGFGLTASDLPTLMADVLDERQGTAR